MKRLVLLALCGFTLGVGVAQAQVPDAGAVIVEPFTGSGSAAQPTVTTTTTTTIAPADALPNPVDDPVAAVSAVKAAKKQGWAAAILATIVMLVAGLCRASMRWPSAPVLSTIAKHKTVIFVVTCLGAGAGAAFNALTQGGDWMAVAWAGVGSVLLFINAGGPPKQA
jgi:hypothetical protein